jgi:hypothetical protein
VAVRSEKSLPLSVLVYETRCQKRVGGNAIPPPVGLENNTSSSLLLLFPVYRSLFWASSRVLQPSAGRRSRSSIWPPCDGMACLIRNL